VNEVWRSTILLQLAINGNHGTPLEFCFNKSFKRTYTISKGTS